MSATHNIRRFAAIFGALMFLVASAAAQAHPGHGAESFSHGLLHPLMGLDHLLAMVAVGLLAMQCGGRAVWAVPAAFVVMMMVGGLLAFGGVAIPLVEPGIAGSVLVFGALLLFRPRLPLALTMAVIGAFAVFHGFAHATEMTAGISAAIYSLGFIAGTSLLHGIGLVAAALAGRQVRLPIVRVGGGVIALSGLVMLVGAV